MSARSSSQWGGLALVVVAGVSAAWFLARPMPRASAEVGRGTEDAFVRGLHVREIPPRGKPQRWTRERAVVSFRNLPAGAAVVDVEVHAHRGPVQIAADGVVLGTLEPGVRHAHFEVPAGPRGLREVELRSSVFLAGDGRALGTLFDRVTVRTEQGHPPSSGLVALLTVPALLVAALAMVAGVGGWWAAGLGTATAALQVAILRPAGILYSPYALRLAVLLGVAAIVCGSWGAFWNGRRAGAGPWAFLALFAAVLVQVVVGCSPVMVVSDAVFHANNLARVAGGDLFLTSMTQHSPPFRFPYGVSFYVLLTPLLRAGLDPVALVRWGAGLAGVVSAGALFALLAARGPRLAAVAVAVLNLMPGSIDVLSFGNLSNAFAQGVTVLFLAWWMGRARGSWPVGAILFVVAALGHLSAFVVLAVLAPWLAWSRWPALRSDRARLAGTGLGVLAASLYYASFASLVTSQLGRLGEQAASSGPSLQVVISRQIATTVGHWGVPVLILLAASVARPRPSHDQFERDLVAWWGAGLVLLALGLATPLDVRWAYGLSAAVSIAAALGAAWLWAKGRAGQVAALVLLACHAVLGARAGWIALWERYR